VAGCVTWLHEQGAKVINMSLVDAAGRTMRAAVRAAWDGGSSTGSVLLAAAGNTDDTGCEYPACFQEVVSVAATNRKDAHPSFSTRNADVEVSAPGASVFSTLPDGYGKLNGTSMAVPHASAVAAVIWQENPSFTAAEVRTRLGEGVDDLGEPGRDAKFGFGRVNLCAALGPVCTGKGPDGRITGTVTSGTGAPLRARVLTVSGPEEATTRSSAIDGSYELAALTPGVYRIEARRTGCGVRAKWVWLSGGTKVVHFALAC
jgi:subtilisin family serine protease